MIPIVIIPDIIAKTSFWQKLVLKVIANESGVLYDNEGRGHVRYGYNPELRGKFFILIHGF